MHILLGIQLALWGTAGISLIALAALDFYRQRDSESLFLFTWIIGTFLFAGFINWTMNGPQTRLGRLRRDRPPLSS